MLIKITVLIIILFVSQSSFALTDSERAALLRASQELDSFLLVIDEAEQAVNPDDQQQVKYQSLRDDIQKIKEGLNDVIKSTRREPRSLPPISGEYL